MPKLLVVFALFCELVVSEGRGFSSATPSPFHHRNLSVTADPLPLGHSCPSRFTGESDDPLSTNITAVCPLGFYCHSQDKCKCLSIPHEIAVCEDKPQLRFAVLDCKCATYDPSDGYAVIGPCVYNCESQQTANKSRGKDLKDLVYHIFPTDNSSLNDYMCGPFNRTGTLCGDCKPGQYPLAYSFNLTCIPCPDRDVKWNWLKYIAAAYGPLTFFCLVVLFFKINTVSSHLFPVIFYSQWMSTPALIRIVYLAVQYRPKTFMGTKILLCIYGIWNLDFFRPYYSSFCLGIGVLPTIAIEYAIGVYPLVFIALTYLLILAHDRQYRIVMLLFRPFQILFGIFKRNWNIRTSVLDAFSTFYFLSQNKILSVTFDLLAPMRVYHLYPHHHNYTFGLYYAGHVQYFGSDHLPYAILALILLLVFCVLPYTVLTFYPFRFFQKLINLLPFRWYILHTFVDTFQGCYKDGTQGTRDCRWFAGLYLSIRLVLYVVYSLTLGAIFFPLCAIILLLLIILVIIVQPYKPQKASHAKINAVFFTLYTMIYLCFCGGDMAGTKSPQFIAVFYTLAVLVALIPLICMLVFFCYWVYTTCKSARQMVAALRRGYTVMGGEQQSEEFCDRVVNPHNYPVLPNTAGHGGASRPQGRLAVEHSRSKFSPLRDCSVHD